MLRTLVLSADVGESHAAMARALTGELAARPDVESAPWLNDFSALGPLLGTVLPRGFRYHLGGARWSYDAAYRVFTQTTPARRAGERALYLLGGGALAATVAAHAPDVVVSTYPVMNPVLARLRAAGRLACPAVAIVGPLSGLRFWVQPKLDLHLALYPEAVAEIEGMAGSSPVRVVRPLVREEFFSPIERDAARDALGLDHECTIVLVSGGGWGAGDLAGAIDATLAIGGVHALAVTGRNAPQRAALIGRYAEEPRVQVIGFTEQMRQLLCASDAFVTATAGISCLEARLCGCPTICYGFAVGHVRDNTAAMVRHGLAREAATPERLTSELRGALAGGRSPIPPLDELPSAADVVAELALHR